MVGKILLHDNIDSIYVLGYVMWSRSIGDDDILFNFERCKYMCYLVAKKFEENGCIAVKTRHGKALADFLENLQQQIEYNGIQLVTVSRPSAYGEYEPYEIIRSKEEFQERVLKM